MLRLVVVLIVSCILGTIGGVVQYTANYRKLDERFATLRASAAPVVPVPEAVDVEPTPVSKADDQLGRVEVVGGSNHDFGSMQQGSVKSHTFVFRNVGQGPLKLDVEGSTCRCTIGKLDTPTIAPGEEAKVTLEWKATGVLNDFSQSATIATSDPRQRKVILAIKGTVSRTVLAEPADFNLGDIPVSGDLHRTAYVFGYGAKPLEITQVNWADEQTAAKVKLDLTPVEIDKEKFPTHATANGAVRLDLTIPAGLPMGPLQSRIVLQTNIENVSDVEMNFTANVVGDIQIIAGPSYDAKNKTLTLGTVDRRAGTTTRLHLSVQGSLQESLKIEVGELVPKDLMIVSVGEPNRQTHRTLYPITCTIPENAPLAMFPGTNSSNFGKIILKTNHPNIPEVRINVRVIVE